MPNAQDQWVLTLRAVQKQLIDPKGPTIPRE